jgi:hypothetical protein
MQAPVQHQAVKQHMLVMQAALNKCNLLQHEEQAALTKLLRAVTPAAVMLLYCSFLLQQP